MKTTITIIIVILILAVGGYFIYDEFLAEEDLDSDMENGEMGTINDQPIAPDWTLEGMRIPQSGNYYDPDIIAMPDGGYRIYYEDAATGEGIKSMVSKDGLTWTLEAGVRIADANMLSAVVLPDNTVRIYYAEQTAQNRYFFAAESTGGLAFDKLDTFRFDQSGDQEAGGIRRPSVIRKQDGDFVLYYDGIDNSGNTRIFAATSDDGLVWERQGVIIEGDTLPDGKIAMSFSPDAIENTDGSTSLFFIGGNPIQALSNTGIYRAESSDGLTFAVPEKPALSAFFYNGDEDNPAGVEDPTIIRTADNRIRLYYSVFTGNAPDQQGIGMYSAMEK